MEHALLRKLGAETLAASTLNNTAVMLMNAGRFHAAVTRLSFDEGHLIGGLDRQSQLERNDSE